MSILQNKKLTDTSSQTQNQQGLPSNAAAITGRGCDHLSCDHTFDSHSKLSNQCDDAIISAFATQLTRGIKAPCPCPRQSGGGLVCWEATGIHPRTASRVYKQTHKSSTTYTLLRRVREEEREEKHCTHM